MPWLICALEGCGKKFYRRPSILKRRKANQVFCCAEHWYQSPRYKEARRQGVINRRERALKKKLERLKNLTKLECYQLGRRDGLDARIRYERKWGWVNASES